MTRLTEERRRRMAKEQRGLCFYCALRLYDDLTWEHLVARYHGGSNAASNLRIAHAKCNSLVGTLPVSTKFILNKIGHERGSDAFFILASRLRLLANAHDDSPEERRRRPKPPPPAILSARVRAFERHLPPELLDVRRAA